MLNPLDEAGRFVDDLPVVGGMFVKDADPLLVEELRSRGRLYDIGTTVHSYPHCWRCESPLLYVARDSWFAATSTLKDRMVANNDAVSWYPPEVGEKRFGEWLRGNVDWALSRDRYWGTPLPVWICDRDPEHVSWIGSLAALSDVAGPLGEDFDPHRPFIDEVTWACRECEGTMRRTPEVLDVWFDSGSMPYAQWHYPFENREEFERHFPADFICEGLDQTRGWFYSLMAISTMLGRGPAYRNVVVNDLILDAEGQKMSKSRGNTVDPWDAIAEHGADAVRWYFVTSSNPWVPKRYDPEGVGEAARKFFDTLFNTYRFFASYAGVEAWRPSDDDPRTEERALVDRWLLSRLDTVVAVVREELDAYQITRAYRTLGEFVVEDVSNWYVRRSRPRFWGKTGPADQRAAFRTLWDALRTVALLAAPCVPFTADWLHRALTGESVHVQLYPAHADRTDRALETDMEAARTLVSLGRAAREDVQIRVRQPLRTLQVVLPGGRVLDGDVLELVRDELNVKEVAFLASAEELVRLVARPSFRSLGPRFGNKTQEAAEAVRALSQDDLAAFREGETVHIDVDGGRHALEPDDLEVVEEALGELVVKGEAGFTVALDPTLDDELRSEGIARELVNRIQRLRKDAGLEITDRIVLAVEGPENVQSAAGTHEAFLTGETLAVTLRVDENGTCDGLDETRAVDIDGVSVRIGLSKAAG
jgi:isoleucyl-tRNA synthetase